MNNSHFLMWFIPYFAGFISGLGIALIFDFSKDEDKPKE